MAILKPHVSLNVSNVEASQRFYELFFGVAATKVKPGYVKFDLAEPSLNLSMVQAERTGTNASHFGVQVDSAQDVASGSAPLPAFAGSLHFGLAYGKQESSFVLNSAFPVAMRCRTKFGLTTLMVTSGKFSSLAVSRRPRHAVHSANSVIST